MEKGPFGETFWLPVFDLRLMFHLPPPFVIGALSVQTDQGSGAGCMWPGFSPHIICSALRPLGYSVTAR